MSEKPVTERDRTNLMFPGTEAEERIHGGIFTTFERSRSIFGWMRWMKVLAPVEKSMAISWIAARNQRGRSEKVSVLRKIRR